MMTALMIALLLLAPPQSGCSGHSSSGTQDQEKEGWELTDSADAADTVTDIVTVGDDTVAVEVADTGADGLDLTGDDSIIKVCIPGTADCSKGLQHICLPDGSGWANQPCPAGEVCENGGCVRNKTAVYLVVDTSFGAPGFSAVANDIYCPAIEEAKKQGSPCAQPDFVGSPPSVCPCPAPDSKGICRIGFVYPAIVSYLLRMLLDAIEGIPDIRVVMIHSPRRTSIWEYPNKGDPYDISNLMCNFGLYRSPYDEGPQTPPDQWANSNCAVGGPIWQVDVEGCYSSYKPLMEHICGKGSGCECSDGPFANPPAEMIEDLFQYSVAGYPDPWSLTIGDLRKWVDGKEEVSDTGAKCLTNHDCGDGTCHEGTCWVHSDPEIRASNLPMLPPVETQDPPSPLLYIASQFVRLHGDTEGKACKTDPDCGPLGGRCGEDGKCHDEAAGCRRHIIIFLSPKLAFAGQFPVIKVARWMKTGLWCDGDGDCAGASSCQPQPDDPEVAEWYPECAEKGAGKMCTPLAPPPSQDKAGLKEWLPYVLAARSEPSPAEPYLANLAGGRVRVTTHVIATLGIAIDVTGMTQKKALIRLIATSIAGGGKIVVPHGDIQWNLPVYLGPFSGDWKDQFQALVEAVKFEATQSVCTDNVSCPACSAGQTKISQRLYPMRM